MRLRILLGLVVACMVFAALGGVAQAFTITASAGPHGSITPSGDVTVAPGASQTFTFTPEAGYSLKDLAVDGIPSALALTYTFHNVTANHTIAAVFIITRHCYSKPDTCYVCYDTSGASWVMTQLDLGICDTVRIGCPVCVDFSTVAVGDSFAVPIYVYSSNAIGGFSLGFHHDGRKLSFGNVGDGVWDATGSVLTTSQKGGILYTVETDNGGNPKADSGSALMGWADLLGTKPVARNTTSAAKLMGSLWLIMTEKLQQTIRFDSAYFQPAGTFILTCRDSTPGGPEAFINKQLVPKFVMCKNFTPPCDIALPVHETNTPALPEKFELGQNVPNPFNPNTAIVFAVPRPSEVRIEVFNVLGQKVKTLANEFSKAGYKRVEWDGTDNSGSSVASGVYLYRMTAGDFSETKKMLLLK